LSNGDYDADGDVDADDYVLWRKTIGQIVNPGTGADGNKNGIVDQNDYNVWRANYTSPTSGAGLNGDSNVPEPNVFISCVFGLSASWLLARWRKTASKA